MSLDRKTILVTRAINQATEMIELIKAKNGIPILFPTIQISPPEKWDETDKALVGFYIYDGVIFTSQNGVLFFVERMKSQNIPTTLFDGKIIFTVGEKTKQALEQYGIATISVPEKSSALELSRLIKQESLKGKCYLFPKGNIAKETIQSTLKNLGATVDEVTVYRTLQPLSENVQKIRTLLDEGKINVVTFTSPSTVKNFFHILGFSKDKNFTSDTKIAVIGPTTESALQEYDLKPDIQSHHSTIESLIESIIIYFRQIA
jgi:uroporphyrinogen-III synthase